MPNRTMRYVGDIYRPPSEAESWILQATIGCSWNRCTYCDMYRAKNFRIRPTDEILEDVDMAAQTFGPRVRRVFVADGDAMVMDLATWESLLGAVNSAFPRLRRVSCYATAMNILEKTPEELRRLRELGLELAYIGPESGDDPTLKRIAKGASFDEHVEAANKLRDAGIKQSTIFLLGVGGQTRSREHAEASARLATAMDPQYLSVLTLTVIPGTPLGDMENGGRFELPDVDELMDELRTFVDITRPTNAVFRTNHASNYLPLQGRLDRDRERLLSIIDEARSGERGLRPEWLRGL